MLSKKDLENFKEFLDSGTSSAKVTKIALIAVAVASLPFVVTGAVAMGNAVQLFNKKKRYTDRQFYNATSYLNRNKFIEYVSEKNGVTTARITRKGEAKLKSFSIDILQIQKPKVWDGKWRVVIFDFPIRYKKVRHSLRYKLKDLGFVQFQKSVWIYPYPCAHEVLFVANHYKLSKYIEVMTVQDITNDIKIKKIFGLSN